MLWHRRLRHKITGASPRAIRLYESGAIIGLSSGYDGILFRDYHNTEGAILLSDLIIFYGIGE